jgi:hypothetical protein
MWSRVVLLVCWGYFIDETEATHSSQSDGSPSLLPHYANQVDIVDVWARPPLTVSGALCGSDGVEVEAPSLLRTILDVGFEWPFQFSSTV